MIFPGFGMFATDPETLARLILDMDRAAATCSEAATRP